MHRVLSLSVVLLVLPSCQRSSPGEQVEPEPRPMLRASLELPMLEPEPEAAEPEPPAEPDPLAPLIVGGAAGPVPVVALLTSRFGVEPGRIHYHGGLDFAYAQGTPVFAVCAGAVEQVIPNTEDWSPYRGYGNAVVIRHHGEEVWSLYAHLNDVAVSVDDEVQAGEVIATIGNTSNGRLPLMGYHLHIEMRRADSDRSSPFPGRIRRLFLDPEVWLARHGIRIDDDGHLYAVEEAEPEDERP